jgi:hypothetical protein
MKAIIETARGEIGQTEKPINSNKTKYGKWAGLDGVAWCGLFCSWIYEQAGKPMPRIGFRFNGFAGCQTAVAYFRTNKKIVTEPQEGDLVFFDWNGDKRHDHVGLFVKWIDKDTIETIEGNTAIGNDSNGGNVMVRKRHKRFCLFVRP